MGLDDPIDGGIILCFAILKDIGVFKVSQHESQKSRPIVTGLNRDPLSCIPLISHFVRTIFVESEARHESIKSLELGLFPEFTIEPFQLPEAEFKKPRPVGYMNLVFESGVKLESPILTVPRNIAFPAHVHMRAESSSEEIDLMQVKLSGGLSDLEPLTSLPRTEEVLELEDRSQGCCLNLPKIGFLDFSKEFKLESFWFSENSIDLGEALTLAPSEPRFAEKETGCSHVQSGSTNVGFSRFEGTYASYQVTAERSRESSSGTPIEVHGIAQLSNTECHQSMNTVKLPSSVREKLSAWAAESSLAPNYGLAILVQSQRPSKGCVCVCVCILSCYPAVA